MLNISRRLLRPQLLNGIRPFCFPKVSKVAGLCHSFRTLSIDNTSSNLNDTTCGENVVSENITTPTNTMNATKKSSNSSSHLNRGRYSNSPSRSNSNSSSSSSTNIISTLKSSPSERPVIEVVDPILISKIHFLGTASATPLPLCNVSSSVFVLSNGKSIMIDCGEGTQHQVTKSSLAVLSTVSAICITHLHGDHFYGIFGVLTSMNASNRTDPLYIIGPPGTRNSIQTVLRHSNCFLNYPREIIEVHANQTTYLRKVSEALEIHFTTVPLTHSVPTVGYVFEEYNKQSKFNNAAIKEVSTSVEDYVTIRDGSSFIGNDGRTYYPHDFFIPARPGRKFAFLQDTRDCRRALHALENCHLMIHESTHDKSQAKLAHKAYHSTTVDATNNALVSKSKNLILTHFSSRYLREPLEVVHAPTPSEPFRLVAQYSSPFSQELMSKIADHVGSPPKISLCTNCGESMHPLSIDTKYIHLYSAWSEARRIHVTKQEAENTKTLSQKDGDRNPRDYQRQTHISPDQEDQLSESPNQNLDLDLSLQHTHVCGSNSDTFNNLNNIDLTLLPKSKHHEYIKLSSAVDQINSLNEGNSEVFYQQGIESHIDCSHDHQHQNCSNINNISNSSKLTVDIDTDAETFSEDIDTDCDIEESADEGVCEEQDIKVSINTDIDEESQIEDNVSNVSHAPIFNNYSSIGIHINSDYEDYTNVKNIHQPTRRFMNYPITDDPAEIKKFGQSSVPVAYINTKTRNKIEKMSVIDMLQEAKAHATEKQSDLNIFIAADFRTFDVKGPEVIQEPYADIKISRY